MMTIKEKLKTLFRSIMIAGIIIIIIGMYYLLFKAGIPDQDPTTEMTIKWMAYYSAGKICLLDGVITFIIGAAGKICYNFIK